MGGSDLEEVWILESTSLDEARTLAAEKWGLEVDEVSVSVIEEEKRLFGLLGKKLKIEARPIAPLSLLLGRKKLKDLLMLMELEITPVISEGEPLIDLVGKDAGIVIGHYGETLKAMEYLLNLMLHSEAPGKRLHLDSEGYRTRREKSLYRLAENAAKKAMQRGKPVSLDPMASWERRAVHIALKDHEGIETSSIGEEPLRRVVIWPKLAFGSREHKDHPRQK